MPRFLHTSDWQLGMTRHFFDEDAQARFTQARFDAIRTIGRLAVKERCEFVLVAGDVFESNQVDRRTVARAMEYLKQVPVPVFLLPGNHDPLDAASVYRSAAFRQGRPDQVIVLEDDHPVPVPGIDNVEVVGAPWTSKRPPGDLLANACARLEPAPGITRVLVGHGATDRRSPDRDNPALIELEPLIRALSEGRIHYVALGDRHSLTPEGEKDPIWYSGTPEATDYDEQDPGQVLVVEVTGNSVRTEPHRVGTWRFVRQTHELSSGADIDALIETVMDLPDKDRTVLKLAMSGTLRLREWSRLEEVLEESGELFAAVEEGRDRADMVVIPDDADFADLDLTGFAATARDELRALAEGSDERARAARDALALLVRLARTA